MSLRMASLFTLALLLVGCLGGLHKSYQPAGVAYYRQNLRQFFIEYSDQGFFWKPEQLDSIVRAIHDEREAGKAPLVLIFVHGWQHSAKDKGKYVKLFRQSLLEPLLSSDLVRTRPVIAVYLGWSGRSTWFPILRQFNFFARYATASRVGSGTDFSFALQQISIAAKAPSEGALPGWVVVGGHSMGSMLLQEALIKLLPTPSELSHDEEGTGISTADLMSLPDQFIFLNSAAHSLQTVEVLTQLARKPLKGTVVVGECEAAAPLFISLSSEGDSTTKITFRGSRILELYPGDRKPDRQAASFPFPYSEKFYWKRTDGNNPRLRTHRISSSLSVCSKDREATVVDGHMHYLPLANLSGRKSSSLKNHCLVAVAQPFDKNFWFVSVPKDISKKHGDIFSAPMVDLVIALVRLRFNAVSGEIVCASVGATPHNQPVAPDG